MQSTRSQRTRPITARRIIALLAALACGWAAYSLYGEAAQDRALAAGVARLHAANAALQQQIAERSMEVAEAQGAAWVEEQARRLGYHLPGESIYVVVPSGSAVPRSGGVGATPPSFAPTLAPSPPATGSSTPRPAALTIPSPPP